MSLVLRRFGTAGLSVTWRAPPAISRNGVITRYVIRVNDTTTPSPSSVSQYSARFTRYYLYHLHPYRTYQISVAAENSAGRGPSQTGTVQFPEAGMLYSKLSNINSFVY